LGKIISKDDEIKMMKKMEDITKKALNDIENKQKQKLGSLEKAN